MANPIHDPKYIVFRTMLTEARLSQQLLQADLAERLKKNQSFISKYERGERRLDFPEFIEIAEVLGISALEFIEEYQARIAKLNLR